MLASATILVMEVTVATSKERMAAHVRDVVSLTGKVPTFGANQIF